MLWHHNGVIMAKCSFCLSCLRYASVLSGDYQVCYLCKTVYKVVDGKIVVVMDSNVINEIGRKHGWKVVE